MTDASANAPPGSPEATAAAARPRWPASAEAAPAGFTDDREYAEWLRTELERVIERNYERIFFARPFKDYEFVFGPWSSQGRMFAIDLINALKPELLALPAGSRLTLLDVGAGCGAGTAMLASCFSHPSLGFTITCDALDKIPEWAELFPVMYRNITMRTDSLYDVKDGSYDIVTASHVIEHIPRRDVAAFIRKLVSVARRLTVVICPWQEALPVHPAHEFSVDCDLIEEVRPDSFTVFRSLGWHNPAVDPALLRCVAMIFRKT